MSSRCRHLNCDKYATFNYTTTKGRLFCKEHAPAGMVSQHRGTRTCRNCSKDASYNYDGFKQRLFCKAHASKGMIDVGIKRCSTPGCWVSTSNSQYKGKCRGCYDDENPNTTIHRNIKVKENGMSQFLKDTGCWPDAVYDKQIMGGKSSFRPDVFIDRPTHAVIVECDEHQHARVRSGETAREIRLQADTGKPIVIIRFNPDRFVRKGVVNESCFKIGGDGKASVRCRKAWNIRLMTLTNEIDRRLDRVPSKRITVMRLFFSDKS